MRVRWVKAPVFKTIPNGGRYNRNECICSGEVVLTPENGTQVKVDFPLGWQTDFTTRPRWARLLIDQTGPHIPAIIIHDRLLETHSRDFARKAMAAQLKALVLVPKWQRRAAVFGVFLNDQLIKYRTKIYEKTTQ